jgi:hypothetical protein
LKKFISFLKKRIISNRKVEKAKILKVHFSEQPVFFLPELAVPTLEVERE